MASDFDPLRRGELGAGEPPERRPTEADPTHRFDPDYHEWRAEQMRQLDKEYALWRQERYRKFAEEFETWRRQRFAGRAGARMPPPKPSHSTSYGAPTSQPDAPAQSVKSFQSPPPLGSANALGTAAPDTGSLRGQVPERGDRFDRPERPGLLSGLLGSHSSRK